MTVSMNYRGSGSSPARSFGDLRAPQRERLGLVLVFMRPRGGLHVLLKAFREGIFFFKKRWILMLLSYLDTAYIFQGNLTS